MRICLVYDCLYPWTVGGAERWLRNLAEALVAEGHTVTYLTRRQWPVDAPPQIPGVDVIAVSREEPLYGPDGNRTIGEPVRFGIGVLRHLAAHGRDYDVVHTASFPYFSLLAAGATRRRGRYAIAADWYEVWSDDYWREYLDPVRGRVARAIQAGCARVSQHAFCFSRLHERRLREIGLRTEPTVLRGLFAAGVECTTPADALQARAPQVMYAGRMIPEKRAPAVVPAVAAAAARVPGLKGLIVGDGPQFGDVQAAIGRHDAQGFIAAPGFGTSDAVADALRASTCMLLPSTREGYGLIVVEAAASGTPSIVVAGPDNAAVELIEEGVNGFVAPDAGEDALADAIVRVHDAGPQLRASTARWYAEHREQLSLTTSLRTVLAGYASAATAP